MIITCERLRVITFLECRFWKHVYHWRAIPAEYPYVTLSSLFCRFSTGFTIVQWVSFWSGVTRYRNTESCHEDVTIYISSSKYCCYSSFKVERSISYIIICTIYLIFNTSSILSNSFQSLSPVASSTTFSLISSISGRSVNCQQSSCFSK